MKHLATVFGLVVVLDLAGAATPPARLSRPALEDKIRGGWAGQMIGVAYGAPTEFRWRGQIIEDPSSGLRANRERAAPGRPLCGDDVRRVMDNDRPGRHRGSEYGEAFKDSQYDLWHANAAGAPQPAEPGHHSRRWSGHPKYNLHANDIDFQIEADFIGIMCPGLPQESNQYCDRVGRVMNYGDGVYGGMFVCGMYAAAYLRDRPAQGRRGRPGLHSRRERIRAR